jgi:serine/threonine protein kinase
MRMPDATQVARSRAPDLIPGYRLETLIGRGGMGEVYRATQLSLGRTVAIKLLFTELAKDEASVARFDKEAAALAALSHPNIVSILDKGRTSDTYYLVMEHIDGCSLREVMRSPTLDAGNSLRMAFQICRAVEYAHGRGVIHRDLKPENILFDEQAGGIPKVSDFGLAAFTDKDTPSRFHLTESHMVMGTFAYMAPEQRLDAKTADHRADIYSLGVILFELLAGELPMGSFEPPSRRKPGLDRQVDVVVARCLKSTPEERYQSATELIADLEPLVPVSSTMLRREMNWEERLRLLGKRVLRTGTKVFSVTVVVAAIIVLGVSALRSKSQRSIQKMVGEQIVGEFITRGVVTAEGWREESELRKNVTIGQGLDRISMVAYGQALQFDRGTLRFALAPNDSPVGRAVPDLTDIEGRAVRAAADVETEVLGGSLWIRAKRFVLGEETHPRAALLLVGTPGRYAAIVLSGRGDPVSFEWALGERRGVTLGTFNAPDGGMRLELSVDANGELRAHAGRGKDRRPIGEPVELGSHWRKSFGDMPISTIGCIEGTCRFRNISYVVEREPKVIPAIPPSAPRPPEPKPQVTSNRPASKSTSAKHTPTKGKVKKPPKKRK